MTRRGFPHSDIPGSKLVCSSPGLFAADRVLHRLLAPRHSPYALSSLTIGIETDAAYFSDLKCAATVPLPTPSHLENTACFFVDTEKLPFAGYSVFKDRRRVPSNSTFATTSAIAKLFSPSGLAQPKPRREPRLAKAGGEYRARTGDLLVANQALSQLS
jgi:hypothetical protein